MIRLGTRGSPLALAQAHTVAVALRMAHEGLTVELETIRTHGDEDPQGNAPTGLTGKALFTQRIEEALVEGRIDAAVHSLKDLPSESLPGIVVAAVPVREDPHDVLVSTRHPSLASMPKGARVATGSLRRSSQLLHARPDLHIEPLTGNVGTRLRKLHENGWDGIILAAAGLRRLGLAGAVSETLATAAMLPAPGQGALAIQAIPETQGHRICQGIEDPQARAAVEAERAFSRALGGDCNVPIAALATVASGMVLLQGCVASPDGTSLVRNECAGPVHEPRRVGEALAKRLLAQGAGRILEAMAP
ncbi:MAG: hydroxymethylbilane synthase [Thermoplasmatota archaeon]